MKISRERGKPERVNFNHSATSEVEEGGSGYVMLYSKYSSFSHLKFEGEQV